ncbi:hypothetical protein AK88_04373 [Plasmodium fragile]|uniref:Uncharacterized protein n=1 Tax=Plasmodium fragile TaxID=5857 RepID=A0A0D9QG24_PLAFR|nr:uncharacterized protein AK88_04373 [Plasmodium fragile]KJP85964.1 hypothetical protein AK88_04373 [Plasmodium fragile]
MSALEGGSQYTCGGMWLGQRSLKKVNVYKRLPYLYLGMFFIGGLLEVVFCSTNFYQIYNIGESEKKSDADVSELMKRYELRQKIKESESEKKSDADVSELMKRYELRQKIKEKATQISEE